MQDEEIEEGVTGVFCENCGDNSAENHYFERIVVFSLDEFGFVNQPIIEQNTYECSVCGNCFEEIFKNLY